MKMLIIFILQIPCPEDLKSSKIHLQKERPFLCFLLSLTTKWATRNHNENVPVENVSLKDEVSPRQEI